MTIETRTLIEVTDMMAIEFECPHCHIRYSVKLESGADRNVHDCPNCNEHWFTDNHPISTKQSDLRLILGFMAAIREMQSREFNAIIRLELRNGEQEPVES